MAIINGTDADDPLSGTGEDDQINGLAGADTLQGLAGNDSLYGGAGDDTLAGGEGSDFADGGDGFDLLDYSAWQDDAGISLDLTLPNRFISNSSSGPAAQEVESWVDVEGIRGTNFRDGLRGNAQDNLLIGGGGDDFLDGREGSDTAAYAGVLADYSIGLRDGVVLIIDNAPADGDDGFDDARNIEVFRFADGEVALAGLPLTVLAFDETAELPDYVSSVTLDVRANDTDEAALSGVGSIIVGSPLAAITAADVSASVVDGRIRLALGSDFASLKPGQVASVSVPYTIADGGGQSDSATLTLTVRGTDPGSEPALRVGDELELNTTRAGSQERPAAAALAGGGFVATWASEGQDGDGYAVIARRFAGDGTPLGGEFQVNTTTTGDQGYVVGRSHTTAVAALADGGFVVVWYATDGEAGGVFAQRFDAQGAAAGGEFPVNSVTAGGQGDLFRGATVAGLADGGFVVSWETKDLGSTNGVYSVAARQFDANGVPLGEEFRVSSAVDPDAGGQGQVAPVVSALPDGGYVVVWRGYGGGDNANIFVRRFDANGAARGADVLVNTETSNNQSRPEVATLADGGFVVAWSHFAATAGDAEPSSLKAQVFNADGTARGGEFLVNTKAAGSQSWVAVAALGNGGFLVSWSDSVNGQFGAPEPGDIKGQLFDAQGQKIGAEFLVNTITSGTPEVSRVVALSATEALVVWMDTQGSDANIAAQRFTIPLKTPGADVVDLTGPGGGTAAGGKGDDVFVVDDPLDVPRELAGEGVDTVRASLSWTLGNNLENLELTGTGDFSGTGNPLANAITGNSGDNTLDGGAGADTLRGGDGDDVYLVDDIGDLVVEGAPAPAFPGRVRPEGSGANIDTVIAQISYTLRDNVENLELAGSIGTEAFGNALANRLSGNIAANLLQGKAGNDTLDGGAGIDVAVFAGPRTGYLVVVNGATVTVTDTNAVDGADGVDVLTGFEALRFADTVQALAGTTIRQGTATAQTFDLRTSGSQAAAGKGGNDTYLVNARGDAAIELADGGTDLVRSAISWQLWEHLENLELTGNQAADGTGNNAANRLSGNGAANKLSGYAGADTLVGGAGADTLIGGSGNDLYIVGAGDVLEERANEGADTVQSAQSRTLAANFENLRLSGAAALNGTGNAAANALTGNGGANTLEGAAGDDTLVGGAGADALRGGDGSDSLDGGDGTDTLAGGAGDDSYLYAAGDVLIETAGQGFDTVRTALNHTLATNFEALVLLGDAAASGVGNAASNALSGNAAANRLSGFAGSDTLVGAAGADTLVGGTGNDLYFVGDGDVLIEKSGEGTDTVDSASSYTLGANLEQLVLSGVEAVNGRGNALANTLAGNDGNNLLEGLGGADTLIGGAGIDVLNGGEGADRFVFDSPLAAGTNVDVIGDFRSGTDRIVLDATVFGELQAGQPLDADRFLSGAGVTEAQTAEHRLIYNTTTGALYYDADGSEVDAAAVQFATLGSFNHPSVSVTDFLIID